MRRFTVLLASCLTAGALLVPDVADAATARTITAATSTSTVTVGGKFAISGKVSKSPKGTVVLIDQKVGSAWKVVSAAKTTTKAGNYKVSGLKTTTAGRFVYRARVNKTSSLRAATSPARTVTSTWARGSVQNPYGVLEQFAVPGWKLRFHPADTDAWPEIEPVNQYNKPPPAGSAYVMAQVDFTRTGSTSKAPYDDLVMRYLDSSKRTHIGNCGVLPSSWYRIDTVAPGETLSGNICAVVPKTYIYGGSWQTASISVAGDYSTVRAN